VQPRFRRRQRLGASRGFFINYIIWYIKFLVLKAVPFLDLIVMELFFAIDRLISADGQGKVGFPTMLALKIFSPSYYMTYQED